MQLIDIDGVVASPSPNFDARAAPEGHAGAVVDTVILHYTGMRSADDALARLCDAASEVSAHFLIEEGGTFHQLVAPDMRAWHAGVSHWRGREGMNHTSIGIELVNPGHEFGYRSFPTQQIECLLRLLEHLTRRFDILPSRFLGHSDVAPARKQDPGELFPWRHLSEFGFGLWADVDRNDKTILAKKAMVGPEITALNRSLKNIGYSVALSEEFSQMTHDALVAFQRHWRPETVNGYLDGGTKNVLDDIEKQINSHEKLIMKISEDDT